MTTPLPFKKSEVQQDDGRIYGKLGSVGLNDIIQMLGMTKRTATISLERAGRNGAIFFKDGVVLHARAGSSRGEEALMKLVDWKDADFVIDDGVPEDTPASISKNADAVLLDVMTKLDEGYTPQLTPFPFLDKPTPEDMERMMRLARSIRPKPPPPPKRQLPRVVAAAGVIAAVALAAVLVQYGVIYMEDPPPPVLPGELRSRDLPQNESISATTLNASIAGRRVDTWTVLASHRDEPRRVSSPRSQDRRPAGERELERQSEPVATAEPSSAVSPSAQLLIVVEPWAELWIDGMKAGETPLSEIPVSAGSHEIVLINPTIVGVIRDSVQTRSGETLRKSYSFHDAGLLRVIVNPWADVYVDGRKVGQTPMDDVKVPVGTHTVELRHPSHGQRVREVQVRRGETSIVRVQW
jgi:hypothetical protein